MTTKLSDPIPGRDWQCQELCECTCAVDTIKALRDQVKGMETLLKHARDTIAELRNNQWNGKT